MTFDKTNSIYYWNRRTARVEKEQVYGDRVIQWIYGTTPGQILADRVLSKAFLSRIYGMYQSSGLSKRKIQPFIQEFKIPMEDFQPGPYPTFNDFFIRPFRAGARPVTHLQNEMPAFAEARYLGFEKITADQKFPVKGSQMSASALMGNEKLAKPFQGGPLLLARLCPTDYHRFHFPDTGTPQESYAVHGDLHSVNPLALRAKGDILMSNERNISILETQNFGKLAYIEVGATCVGKIVQSHPQKDPFVRGDEKGYFLFGGSTVIVLGEPGAWKPDADLLEQTSLKRETLVRLGECVASKS